MDVASSIGYIRLKEFNALAKKDLVTGNCRINLTAQCVKFLFNLYNSTYYSWIIKGSL